MLFYVIKVCFLLRNNDSYSDNKNYHDFFTLVITPNNADSFLTPK